MTGRLQRTVMTAAVAAWVDGTEPRRVWLGECLGRHLVGDWGDLDPDDWAANDRSRRWRSGRLLSVYDVPAELHVDTDDNSALWIITDDLEDPDTATTILWPSDY